MGPMEYAVFRFPGNEFNGSILPALGRLVDSGTIAVLDLLFITKDADGKAAWVELQERPRRDRWTDGRHGRPAIAAQRGGRGVRGRRHAAEQLRRTAGLGGQVGRGARERHPVLRR